MKTYKEIIQTVLELHRKEEENSQLEEESEPRIGWRYSPAIEELRKSVPEEILAHHDNLRPLGKKSVATVKEGCCGGCSRSLPPIDRIAVESGEWPVMCNYCGVLLYDEEILESTLEGPERDATHRIG